MMVGMDHVGIAVKSLDEAVRVYRDVLGFRLEGVHVLEEQVVRVAVFSSGDGTNVELLEPLDSQSAMAKFLEKRGEGIHHIAVRVEDIEAVIDEFRKRGVVLIDEKPKDGVGGAKIAFVHPRSTRGVLLELVMK
jgi:methylmalonyl-CoA/ethylmalonyl-CoA epimerase